MTDRAKRLSALYRAHAKAEGAEKARLRAELDRLLDARSPETEARIARAVETER
jgi:hypothetical protein